MTHIMLDLETWGKRPGCDIRSIGACVFDPIAGTIDGFDQNAPKGHRITSLDGKFYAATDNPIDGNGFYDRTSETYRKYPLTRDPETVQWWNDQGEEAQAAFANPVDLRKACDRFSSWIINMYPGGFNGELTDDIKVWSCGPQFDVSILAAVYDAVGLSVPWHYRAPRDFRTITEAADMTRDDYCNYGTAHNALDDAIAQAMTVCEAYKRLGLQLCDDEGCPHYGTPHVCVQR